MINLKSMLCRLIPTLMIICFITTNTGNINFASATENKWVSENFKLPIALRGACVEYVDGKMYVIGGETTTWLPMDQVHIYDFSSDSWSLGASMPRPIFSTASCTINGNIYIFGGVTHSSGKNYTISNVEIYNPKTDTWSSGKNMPLPTSQAIPIEYQDKIYFFGGINADGQPPHKFHETIQIYDIKSNSWSIESGLPFTRYGYTINVINDKVYLIGGANGIQICNDVKIYDLTNNTWSDGTPMNYRRHYASSIAFDNKIYMIGGYTVLDEATSLYETEVYNVITDTWSREFDLNMPRLHLRPIILDNKIIMIGGETSLTPSILTDKIESLQLPSADNRLFAHLYINEKTQLSFTHNLTDNQNLTWKSSDTKVAKVDNNGIVTALKKGTAHISAYSKDGTFLDYMPVIVTENDAYRIAVHLDCDQTQRLYIRENSSGITWTSMDQSVATVDNNGIVTGINKGLAIVKAKGNNEEYYIYVRIN